MVDWQQIGDCHYAQNDDSTKLTDKLIGNWQWTYHYSELQGTTKADKDVKLTFTASGTFSVTENSIVITDGNWKIKYAENNGFKLDLSHSSRYLHGIILLCDNEVLFNSSYVDGNDYLFERIN